MDLLLISGESLYGKVDHVPGWFYVKTKFAHLYFLPLMPQQSFLIMEGSEKQSYEVGAPVEYRGMPIPLCRRSVRIAWMRHICALLATIFLVLAGVGAMSMLHPVGSPEDQARLRILVLVFTVSGGGLVILAVWTWFHSRATPPRAVELCRLASLDPDRLHYHLRDRASRQQLESLLGPRPVNDQEIDSP